MTELSEGFALHRHWLQMPDGVFGRLLHGLAWEQPLVRVFGQSRFTPRMVCAFGDVPYSYSGLTHQPAPWDRVVATIRAEIKRETGARFNTCLANLYRDGSDSIAWHADDEPELGERPTIASISLGAARTFAIKRRADGRRINVRLESGDLLVMSGNSQRDFLHSVPKTKSAHDNGPRINLTFRYVNSR